MKIGIMWFDNSDSPLSTKIEGAVLFYVKKYNHLPTLAVVNPSTVIDECDITIETSRSIMPNHIWIGINENGE